GLAGALRMSGLLKIGQYGIEIPMFSEAAQLRAGHGRRGAAIRELARALDGGRAAAKALVLGAAFGGRMAGLKTGGRGSVLCLGAEADRFAVLERNVGHLGGGNALQARLGNDSLALAPAEIFARYPAFEEARLLLSEGSQDGPAAVEGALPWLRERHPLLVLE